MQNNTLSRADLNYESGTVKNVHYGDVLIKFGDYIDASKIDLPYISDDTKADKFKSSFLQDGDIIIADTAEDDTVGKCTEIQGSEGLRLLSGLHTIACRPKEKYGPMFLGYYINSPAYHNQLKPLMQGIKVTSISKSALQNTDMAIPKSIDEQITIGKYFSYIDNLITLHQRKYDKLVNVKKAMLEKMFPKDGADVPEIRFKGFTEAWEQRKLDEIVSFFSGLTYSPNDIRPTGTLVLRSSNVKDGEVIDADNVYVDPSVVNSDNVHDGDIIVVVRNGSRTLIGKHAEIKGLMPNTVIGAFMTGIRSEHPSFLNSLLSTPHFDKEIERNMGATINQITGYMFSKMEFMIPSSKEQDAIGEYFKRISNLITLHQRKLLNLV